MFGLRPWLAFFRRTEAFFLEVLFDMVDDATGPGSTGSRRGHPEQRPGQPSRSSNVSSFVVGSIQLRIVMR